jgi:glycosyltransferase involved in cell wall biosynthesis
MWQGHSVSVILPTYNEKDSIRQVILDFFATGVVDEVMVINNNAAPGTSEEVAGTGAIEIHERRQGYGNAIRRGLGESERDYLIICEPDATFLASDVFKLLAYAEDFDIVYGSRTSQQLIWHGANMGLFLRWGNWAVAKYMEVLYNSTSLTDVGCTYRLVHRDAARALAPYFKVGGSEFGPEMMITSLKAGYSVIQIPLNYLPRVGTSSVTGDPVKAFFLGLKMIWLITRKRLKRLGPTDSGRPRQRERRR